MKKILNSFFSNFASLSGQNGIFVNIHQDFTDKYLQCVCGRFYALGNVTASLDEIMLCDYPLPIMRIHMWMRAVMEYFLMMMHMILGVMTLMNSI